MRAYAFLHFAFVGFVTTPATPADVPRVGINVSGEDFLFNLGAGI